VSQERIFADLSVWDNLEVARRAATGARWTVERVYAAFPILASLDRRRTSFIDLRGEVVRVGLDAEATSRPAPCGDGPNHRLERILGVGKADTVAQPAPLQERRFVEAAEDHHGITVRWHEAPVVA